MENRFKFAVVPVEQLQNLFDKLDDIQQEIQKLHWERELPERLTIREAASILRLSPQRVYGLIYTHKIKGIQHARNGKVLISREELLRYKGRNEKSAA